MEEQKDAAQWLASLPEYPCTICGEKTIFKGECPDCEQRRIDAEDLENLPRQIEELDAQIAELKAERAKRVGELEALKRKMERE